MTSIGAYQGLAWRYEATRDPAAGPSAPENEASEAGRGGDPEAAMVSLSQAARDYYAAKIGGASADALREAMRRDREEQIKIDPSQVYSIANGRLKPIVMTDALKADFAAYKARAAEERDKAAATSDEGAASKSDRDVMYLIVSQKPGDTDGLDQLLADDRTGARSDWSNAVLQSWIKERFGGGAAQGAGSATSASAPAAKAASVNGGDTESVSSSGGSSAEFADVAFRALRRAISAYDAEREERERLARMNGAASQSAAAPSSQTKEINVTA